ncbi:MAG TPA: peptidoglycan DD-metalloendopeptidase family protein [Candidatus Binatia bacterium]
MDFKLIAATGTLIGVLALAPVSSRAGQPLPGEGAERFSSNLNSSVKVSSTALPPADTDFLPEGLRALKRITYKIQTGDSLSQVLVRYGVSVQDRKVWLQSIQKHLPLSAFRPDKEVQLYFNRQANGREQLKAIEVEQNADSVLTWEKGTRGIVFSRRENPYEVEIKTAGGVVETTLIQDSQRVGLNAPVLSQLVELFSWDVDFEKEIQKGDTFKVVYEQRSRPGDRARPTFRILAAELINSGRRSFAMYFEKEKGKGAYYDLTGHTLARAFLRFPLDFIEITSTFSDGRLHPILGMDRPHHGVDFAAKLGTPVRAVADGMIVFAGWQKGGYGRLIDVEHDSHYSSRYAHLQSFANGIRSGMKVLKGQVIGFVGKTGLSTGPHLHFEIRQDNEYVDPLKFDAPAEVLLEPALLKLFESRKQLFLTQLAATPLT